MHYIMYVMYDVFYDEKINENDIRRNRDHACVISLAHVCVRTQLHMMIFSDE